MIFEVQRSVSLKETGQTSRLEGKGKVRLQYSLPDRSHDHYSFKFLAGGPGVQRVWTFSASQAFDPRSQVRPRVAPSEVEEYQKQSWKASKIVAKSYLASVFA